MNKFKQILFFSLTKWCSAFYLPLSVRTTAKRPLLFRSYVASPSIKIKVYWRLPFLMWFLQQQLAQLQKEKSEILKNLALYYFTFVDVMEFKVGANSRSHTGCDVTCKLTRTSTGGEGMSLVMKAALLSLQDHVCELLNTIDACQVFFDIVS